MSARAARAARKSTPRPTPITAKRTLVIGELTEVELAQMTDIFVEGDTAADVLRTAQAQLRSAEGAFTDAQGAIGTFARIIARKRGLDPGKIAITKEGLITTADGSIVKPDAPKGSTEGDGQPDKPDASNEAAITPDEAKAMAERIETATG